MNTAAMIIWMIGWISVWGVYLACGTGIYYFWRKGEILPFGGCIAGAIATAVLLLCIGV